MLQLVVLTYRVSITLSTFISQANQSYSFIESVSSLFLFTQSKMFIDAIHSFRRSLRSCWSTGNSLLNIFHRWWSSFIGFAFVSKSPVQYQRSLSDWYRSARHFRRRTFASDEFPSRSTYRKWISCLRFIEINFSFPISLVKGWSSSHQYECVQKIFEYETCSVGRFEQACEEYSILCAVITGRFPGDCW